MSKRHIIRFLIIVPLCSLLSGCASNTLFLPVKPSVSVQSITFGKISLSEQELIFDLLVDNPNPFSIPISGSDFSASIGGQQLAKGNTQDSLIIGASGKTVMPILIKSDLVDSLAGLTSLFKKGSLNLNYALDGKLNVDLGFFPLGIPFQLEGNIADDLKSFVK